MVSEPSESSAPAAPSSSPEPAFSPAALRILPWIVAVAFFMQMLDTTILNTALPGMAASLNVDPLRMQSVVVSYMLATALFIPASSWLAERFGMRRVFVCAIGLFTLGSLLCAVSPTLEALAASRVVQGLGGALMVPVGRLIIIRTYPREQLVQQLSFITLPGLIGPVVGPVLGGFLVQYASWHWIFLINLPVGVLGAFLALRHMPKLPAGDAGHFDGMGFVLFGCSMVLITLAMEGFGELHLPRAQATLLCVGGLGAQALYWLRAGHMKEPLFRPRLFRVRSFCVGIMGNLFARLGSGAMPFLMPLFFQVALGYSPLMAGLTMIPMALAGIAGKRLINRMLRVMGFRRFLTVNTALQGIVTAGFFWVDSATPYLVLLALLALLGLVNSMQFTALNSIVLIDLPDDDSPSGNGLLSVTMQLANSSGVAMGAAVLAGFAGGFAVPGQAELMGSFHATYVAVGAIGILSALIFTQVPAEAGRRAGMTQGAS